MMGHIAFGQPCEHLSFIYFYFNVKKRKAKHTPISKAVGFLCSKLYNKNYKDLFKPLPNKLLFNLICVPKKQ